MSLSQWDSNDDLHRAVNHGWGEETPIEDLRDYKDNPLIAGDIYWSYLDELYNEEDALDFLEHLGAVRAVN